MTHISTQAMLSLVLGRVCHDLASPLGGVQFALETNDLDAMQSQMERLLTRFNFIRLLVMSQPTLEQILLLYEDYAPKIRVHSTIKNNIEQKRNKCFLIMLVILEKILYQGGEIIIDKDQIIGKGRIFLTTDWHDYQNDDTSLSYKTSFLAWLELSAREINCSAKWTTDENMVSCELICL